MPRFRRTHASDQGSDLTRTNARHPSRGQSALKDKGRRGRLGRSREAHQPRVIPTAECVACRMTTPRALQEAASQGRPPDLMSAAFWRLVNHGTLVFDGNARVKLNDVPPVPSRFDASRPAQSLSPVGVEPRPEVGLISTASIHQSPHQTDRGVGNLRPSPTLALITSHCSASLDHVSRPEAGEPARRVARRRREGRSVPTINTSEARPMVPLTRLTNTCWPIENVSTLAADAV